MSSIIFIDKFVFMRYATNMKTISTIKPRIVATPNKVRRPPHTRLLIDIATLRSGRRITLRDVEREIKVGTPVMSEIENGCTPRLDTALRIAAFLELPVERIWALKK